MMKFRPLYAALLITVSLPAAAQSGSLVIKTDDLNLASEAGRATLEQRIGRAERQYCASATASESRIRASEERNACRSEFRRQIEAQFPAARKNG